MKSHEMFIPNKYYRWYRSVTSRDDDVGYVERHHRLPRSMGGDNEKTNIVRLSFRKHFLAHWLLTKCTAGPDHFRMLKALAMMVGNRKSRCTSWQFVLAKTANRLSQTGRPSPMRGRHLSADSRRKISESHLGGKHSPEHRRKISEGGKGRIFSDESKRKMGAGKVGIPLTPEHRQKLAAAKQGKQLSPEHRAKISVSLLGNSRTLGTRHSAETKEKMSRSLLGNKNKLGVFPTQETRQKLSAAQSAAWARRKRMQSGAPYDSASSVG